MSAPVVLSIGGMHRSAEYLDAVGLDRRAEFLRIAAKVASEGKPLTGRDRDTVEALIRRARDGYESLSAKAQRLTVDPR